MPLIVAPDSSPFVLNLVPGLELREQESCQNIGGKITGANIYPAVLVYLPPEELAAVRPFLTDYQGPLYESGIVHDQRPAFSTSHILSFMETLRSKTPKRAGVLTLVPGK